MKIWYPLVVDFVKQIVLFFGSLWNNFFFEGHVFIFHEIFSDVGILAVPVGVGMGGGGGGTWAFIVDCTLGVVCALFHG